MAEAFARWKRVSAGKSGNAWLIRKLRLETFPFTAVELTKEAKDGEKIRPHMWQEILKKQLKVNHEYFNSKKSQNCMTPLVIQFESTVWQ